MINKHTAGLLRRILCMAIAVVMCLSLFGCGNSSSDKDDRQEETEDISLQEEETTEPADEETEPEETEAPTEPIPEQELLNELLYGSYAAEGLYAEYDATADYSEFLSGMEYYGMNVYGNSKDVTVLPWCFTAYPIWNDTYNSNTECQKESWRQQFLADLIAAHGDELGPEYYQNYLQLCRLSAIQVFVLDPSESSFYATYVYNIEGNTMTISSIEYDETTYEYTLTELMQYQIYQDGTDFVISIGDVSIRYVPEDFCGKNDPTYTHTYGYVADDSQAYQNIAGVLLIGDPDYEADSYYSTSVRFTDGGYAIDPIHRFNDDGTLTISWDERYEMNGASAEKVEEHTELTFEYVWGGEFGFIVIDEGNYYLYQTDDSVYRENKLGMNTDNLSDNQIDQLINTQTDILQALIEAFRAAGIEVEVDEASGKVTLGAQFLFATGESALSDDGKAFLDDFLAVYTSVLMSEEYASYISEIIVEGHTDDVGSYNFNQTLSEARAASVYDYCVGVDSRFGSIISTKGCSYSELIYNSDGSVNQDASRRVTFRFVLNTNN